MRFHVVDKRKLLVCGYWKEQEEKGRRILAAADYRALPISTERRRSIKSPKAYVSQGQYEDKVFHWIDLSGAEDSLREVRVFEREELELKEILRLDEKWLNGNRNAIPLHIDEVCRGTRGTIVRGWCIAKSSWEVQIKDGKKDRQRVSYTQQRRPDVEKAYPECEREWIHGFILETDGPLKGKISVEILCDGETETVRKYAAVSVWMKGLLKARRWTEKIKVYYQQFGFCRTLQRGVEKLSRTERSDYETFRLKYMPSGRQLEQQKKERFGYTPQFSVVVPLYRTPIEYLDALIRSVQAQTYAGWKLYLSNGSGEDATLKRALQDWAGREPRIRVIENEEQLDIAENTNRALAQADGDFIVFADHDDMLAPDALYECAKVLNQFRDTDLLYTDEDKISMDGREHYQPHFKPDFNIDLLRSANYMCHLLVVRRTLVEEAGYLDGRYNGSQDYDFILRCIERTQAIRHIPKILYHWRMHPNSVAGNPDSKRYAYEAGRKAILAHYQRTGIRADVEFLSPGFYRSVYRVEEEPLLSIIIPNKDHRADLQRCLESIRKHADYRNYEVLIVENNSTGQEILEYYRQLEEEDDTVRVLRWQGGFNYAAIQNYAVRQAKGSYVLLLNNDTWMAEGSSIRQMLAYAMRPDVGIVGAKLLYPDDTIQHAGVIVGLGGVAGHAFTGLPAQAPGYFCRITCAQEYSAVTAACMMVRKSVYEEIGGMDTDLEVAFNDTDFCLRAGEHGYRIVYQPTAVWYHDESKTRGAEDTEEKLERFRREVEFFQRRWKDFLENGDPCYNPNLTLEKHDFSLRN